MHTKLREAPLDPAAVAEIVAHPGCGANVLFVGTTRDHDGPNAVVELEYEANERLALAELARICDEVQARWPGARCAIEHRLGRVLPGEASVVIAVATPHRDACWDASRYAIEELKRRVPVFKREVLDHGARWKPNEPA